MPRKLITCPKPELFLMLVDNFNRVEFLLDGAYTPPHKLDDVPFFWPSNNKTCAYHLHADVGGYNYISNPMETISLSIVPEDKNIFALLCRSCGFRLEIDIKGCTLSKHQLKNLFIDCCPASKLP